MTPSLGARDALLAGASLAWLLGAASCRPSEPTARLPRADAPEHAAMAATAAAPSPSTPAGVDASSPLDAGAATTADAARCRTAKELFAETSGLTPKPLVPGLDLDGDGKNDPVFVTSEGGPMTVVLYVEKGGCARYLGALHANDLETVRVHGRDEAGWAIVHGSMPFTFDELEEKVVYDGTRYVTWSRRRDYPLPPPGRKRTISPWSAWSRDE